MSFFPVFEPNVVVDLEQEVCEVGPKAGVGVFGQIPSGGFDYLHSSGEEDPLRIELLADQFDCFFLVGAFEMSEQPSLTAKLILCRRHPLKADRADIADAADTADILISFS